MRLHRIVLLLVAGLAWSGLSMGSPAVDTLLEKYRQEGANTFSAEAGEALWTRKFSPANAKQPRQCATCHSANPRNIGKHSRTGKPIEPMAPSINGKRLTEVRKIKKWFHRNCKWTVGRECTAQEKGDLLTWLQQL